MSKKIQSYIRLQILSGMANPSPPIGPALGQKGVNIIEFCKLFNSKTESFEKGTPITTVITVYSDKSFTFIIKTPPASFLLKKFAGIDLGSNNPNKTKVGKVNINQIIEILKIKKNDMTGSNMESNIKTIIGTAHSIGITVENINYEKKSSKRIINILSSINLNKLYSLNDSIEILKKNSLKTFIESLDVSVNLNIDTKNPDKNIRNTVILPNGTGRYIRIAVFAQGEDAILAKNFGADIVGTENLIKNIKNKKINFDIVLAFPNTMDIVGSLAQILGPKGLMPNIKIGTITNNIEKKIKNIRSGEIIYKNDKNGVINTSIGRINFKKEFLEENFDTFIKSLNNVKPKNIKGKYIKSLVLSTTMGIGLNLDINKLNLL